jgi:hypothetical protein
VLCCAGVVLQVDIYLYCLMVQLVGLCACELRNEATQYGECVQAIHTLASHFIRLGLPVIERLLELEPTFVRENIFSLSMKGEEEVRGGGAHLLH